MTTYTFKVQAVRKSDRRLVSLEKTFEADNAVAAADHVEKVINPEIEADHFGLNLGTLSSSVPEGYYNYPNREWTMGELPYADRPVFAGYSQNQMAPAFDLVKDSEHWKNPIDKVIPADSDTNLIHAAVAFYTGSHAEFTPVDDGLRVTADGYYVAIGA